MNGIESELKRWIEEVCARVPSLAALLDTPVGVMDARGCRHTIEEIIQQMRKERKTEE